MISMDRFSIMLSVSISFSGERLGGMSGCTAGVNRFDKEKVAWRSFSLNIPSYDYQRRFECKSSG